ncbi:biotin synthase BioB [Anaeromyxobacter paludicola]|uniref:Biotin synthase n=1 Tax=Anaeromyxobacter paludicola TaxID=2918171 RepID=A0ABM7XF03_9BACT|nr:biotin synthase BioB [Anaeromyxobacter paludicola]BDG10470.1 biotin synthase [Anaeromyxobacter paludicola]
MSKRPLPPGIEPISAEEAYRLIRQTDPEGLAALMARARAVREAVHGKEVSLCGITSAKSGHCPEDCGFCQQSAHFKDTGAPEYPMIGADEMVAQAKLAEQAGAREFSIVASGTRVSKESELRTLEEAVRRIRAETTVEPCASLGLMRRPELERLKAAGLMHYHHNLETARSHFGNVCTTHTYDEQLETVRAAKALGFELCTGGILGMGETPEQRVELALTLRELEVDCIPVNFLNPRPGTPMQDLKAITPEECLAALAVFRLVMPAAHVFVMGGREVNLGGRQDLIFEAGADGTMVGNYLTSAGMTPEQVVSMIRGQGLEVRPTPEPERWAFRGQAPGQTGWNTRAPEGDARTAKPRLPVVGQRPGCA